ncbi:hypothetical protein P5673_021492 [Acropora cervicornis]|uniref:Kazal-like domain-containing protein n=1 Tax=Acropora cervicornis TaxID=6130 RepID=A0AAD9V0A8_ACRCE|nr:hypothetical protein P5673_021492 [Acropora cervicornis]
MGYTETKIQILEKLAPSRSSSMTRPLHQAVTVWLEWVNTTGFSACVETSGPSDDLRVVNVHWLAFRGQPFGSAAGIIEIPFWTTGSSHILSRVPEVFVTPIHRNPRDRKTATSIWTENVSSVGFKIFLRELTNFSGGHKHVRVQWIAFVATPRGWEMPEKSKLEFGNENHPERDTQYSFCQDRNFQAPFYQTPVLLLSPSHKWIMENALYINPENNAITSWVERLDVTSFTACVKDLQLYDERHDPLTVYYIAFGDIHPCHNVECPLYASCQAYGPFNASCVCNSDVPTYEDEVCSQDGVTFQNSPTLELESCVQGRQIIAQSPGSCEPLVFYRGRTHVYLGDTEAHCRQVVFENSAFLENKPVHIHVTVNYFNTSGLFTHEAAVAWTEEISHSSFQVCVLTAGRLDRIPPDGGLTFVDFIAYQSNPIGSVTGHELLDSWWDGTTCKEITLPEDKFSRPPYILVSTEHTFLGRKHDAATVWSENVESTKFTLCLREMQNFDGLHESIVVDWIAFSELPEELDVAWQTIIFQNYAPVESLSVTNYAFCKTLKFDVFFSATPYVIVSAYHNSDLGFMPEEHNSIATWVENINSTHCRICMKELHSPLGYDPVNIDLLAIGSGAE